MKRHRNVSKHLTAASRLSCDSLFCGEPFLFHESMGGFIEYSSSSTSGVAVGTEFPVIDVAVSVGVVMVACDVVGWPGAVSGFMDPPDIADNVSSFSSLQAHARTHTQSRLIKSERYPASSLTHPISSPLACCWCRRPSSSCCSFSILPSRGDFAGSPRLFAKRRERRQKRAKLIISERDEPGRQQKLNKSSLSN